MSEKWGFSHTNQENRVGHIPFVGKRGLIIYLAALKKGAVRHAHPYYAIYRKLPSPPPPTTHPSPHSSIELFSAHARPLSWTPCLILWLKFTHGLALRSANGIGSGETVRIHKLAWTFAVRICYNCPFSHDVAQIVSDLWYCFIVLINIVITFYWLWYVTSPIPCTPTVSTTPGACLVIHKVLQKSEPAQDKTYHNPRRLIRIFAYRMCLLQPPGYPKRDKREPLPHWVDAQAYLILYASLGLVTQIRRKVNSEQGKHGNKCLPTPVRAANQRAHDVYTTPHWRRCDVMALHRR